MAYERGEITCDSCSTPNDGDFDAGMVGETHGLIDPAKVRELTFFWLCGDCSPEYPAGAKDFFVSDYFVVETPYCSECEIEDVSEWGQTCGLCE